MNHYVSPVITAEFFRCAGVGAGNESRSDVEHPDESCAAKKKTNASADAALLLESWRVQDCVNRIFCRVIRVRLELPKRTFVKL